MRKELGAKFDRKLSATERDKQVDVDLGVVFKRKVMFASHTQLEKIRLEVFQKSPDWKNAKEVVELSSAGAGTAKRNLGTQISGYNKVKHVVLGVRRDVVALVQTKQVLEIKKASAQKQARSGGSSAGRSRSGKKK